LERGGEALPDNSGCPAARCWRSQRVSLLLVIWSSLASCVAVTVFGMREVERVAPTITTHPAGHKRQHEAQCSGGPLLRFVDR
jgi:hypothetical protein